jgi:hypothetical protein
MQSPNSHSETRILDGSKQRKKKKRKKKKKDYCLRSGLNGSLQDPVLEKVRLASRRRTQQNRFISLDEKKKHGKKKKKQKRMIRTHSKRCSRSYHLHVLRVGICLTKHGYRLDSQILSRALHSASNFSSVGNQNLFKKLGSRRKLSDSTKIATHLNRPSCLLETICCCRNCQSAQSKEQYQGACSLGMSKDKQVKKRVKSVLCRFFFFSLLVGHFQRSPVLVLGFGSQGRLCCGCRDVPPVMGPELLLGWGVFFSFSFFFFFCFFFFFLSSRNGWERK